VSGNSAGYCGGARISGHCRDGINANMPSTTFSQVPVIATSLLAVLARPVDSPLSRERCWNSLNAPTTSSPLNAEEVLAVGESGISRKVAGEALGCRGPQGVGEVWTERGLAGETAPASGASCRDVSWRRSASSPSDAAKSLHPGITVGTLRMRAPRPITVCVCREAGRRGGRARSSARHTRDRRAARNPS